MDIMRERLPKDLRQAARIMAETGTFETGQAIMEDAAAEIERLRSENNELRNQLDSALHSVDVLERRLRALTTWHRIDDPDNPPPKDGTIVLAIIYGVRWLVYSEGGDWFTEDGEIIGFPESWRPLPPLPPEVK